MLLDYPLFLFIIIILEICTSHNPQDDRCNQRHTCEDCISEESDDGCVWCESHNQCLSKAVYHVTFPYLQCIQVLERGTGTCSSKLSFVFLDLKIKTAIC